MHVNIFTSLHMYVATHSLTYKHALIHENTNSCTNAFRHSLPHTNMPTCLHVLSCIHMQYMQAHNMFIHSLTCEYTYSYTQTCSHRHLPTQHAYIHVHAHTFAPTKHTQGHNHAHAFSHTHMLTYSCAQLTFIPTKRHSLTHGHTHMRSHKYAHTHHKS